MTLENVEDVGDLGEIDDDHRTALEEQRQAW